MPVAPLLAPGGVEMRVVSQVAAFTWGSWQVTWPEGYEPPDPPAEDRELGWIADIGGDEVEPFGRCFVRADAQIDATLGRSNVEDVLDAAKYRTSGEVFLETEIPFENLAGQLPYRDFNVNSFVPVRVGGRILEDQLVTKVAESEDEQGKRTATVYLGGQKFQDREALRTANREIDRVIAQERLERGDEIGARLAASQEYEREQRGELKKYVDRRDEEDLASAKEHAEDEDKKLKRAVDERVGPEGTLTRLLNGLNKDYQAKLGANGTVIADQAAHQRMLEGIVYGKPVSELTGTAFAKQQQAINEMNAAFQGKQTSINEGFDFLFGLNEKINLAQDYTIAHHRLLAQAGKAHHLVITCEMKKAGGVLRGDEPVYIGGDDAVRDLFDVPVVGSPEGIRVRLTKKNILSAHVKAFASFAVYGLHTGSFNRPGPMVGSEISIDGTDRYLIFSVDEEITQLMYSNGKTTINIQGVVFFPGKLIPFYQEQLDALDAEYRAKGLRV